MTGEYPLALAVGQALLGSLFLLDGGTTIVSGRRQSHFRRLSMARPNRSQFELRAMAAYELVCGSYLLLVIAVGGGSLSWLSVVYSLMLMGAIVLNIVAKSQRR